MFLTRLVRARIAGTRERGSALIVVIGISAAVAIMGVTLVSMAIFTLGQSSGTRANIQAQASAENSLDRTLSMLRGVAMRGAENTAPCTANYTDTVGSGTAVTAVKITYGGASVPVPTCPVPAGLNITTAEMVATTKVAYQAGDGRHYAQKVVKQRMTVGGPAVTTGLFPYGVFSHGNLQTTNNFTLTGGAGMATNGSFDCNTNSSVYGNITAIGSVNLTNSCVTKSVWTGGLFVCTTDAHVQGDVLASGTGRSYTTNNCKVDGSATVGGDFDLQNTTKVAGNITAATGYINAGSTVRVTGYARAGGRVMVDNVDAPASSPVFGSGRTPNAPSAVPVPPTASKMPSISWTDLTPTGTNIVTMQSWLPNYAAGTCQADRGGSGWGMNTATLDSPSVPTVIDARNCDAVFQDYQGGGEYLTLRLKADLTIVTRKFTSGNLRVVNAKTDGTPAKLRIIVPVDAASAALPGFNPCSPQLSGGEIRFNNNLDFAPDVDAFIYSYGQVTLTNNVTMTGSVYGCTTYFSENTNITYADMTPPGMTGPSGPTYSFQPTARYGVTG